MRKISLVLLAIVAVSLFLGCSDNNKTTTQTNTQSVPKITILSPENGATLTEGNIIVTVQISNFDLTEKSSSDKSGGHVHYYLDVEPPTQSGAPAIPASGTYVTSKETSHTWPNIPAGVHTIAVQLVNIDHTPLESPATAKVTVNIKAADKSSEIPKEEPTSAQSVLWKADGIVSENEYKNSKELGNGKITVFWTNDEDYIYMAVKGQTSGWISIGFEPTQAMKNADMIFGWVSGGTSTVLDLYSTGAFGPHPPDQDLGGTNDLIESGGNETSGMTLIEFKRKLNTGDKYDKPFKKGLTINLIWGVGSSDSLNSPHTSRGSGSIDIE